MEKSGASMEATMKVLARRIRQTYLENKTRLLPAINRSSLSIAVLWLRVRSTFSNTSHRENVVILGDYLDFSSTLHHVELSQYNIILVVTRRYIFGKLLQHFPPNLYKIVLVDNFEYSSRESTKEKLRPFNPVAILIQSGEFIVPTYNYLNREFKLGGNSEKVSQISLSKKAMREAMIDAGIPCIKFMEISDDSDIDKVDFYPVVIKPTISTGSAGVRLVESREGMVEAMRLSKEETVSTDFQTEYIVEEYISGRQFDFEGIIVDGKPVIIIIVEECYQGLFPIFDHSWFLFNVPLEPSLKERMCKTVEETITAAGIRFGAFHCEAKLDSDGELKVIEFSNRMGTGFEEKTTKCSGIDYIGSYIRELLGKGVTIGENKNLVAFQRYCTSDEEIDNWLAYLDENNYGQFNLKRSRYRTFHAILWIEGDFEFIRKAAKMVIDVDLEA